MMPATVLVVDDEEELLEIFAAWLEIGGYRVLTAPNGAEALKVLATKHVDALISDIRMPIMDGPTVVRRLQERSEAIPVLIFVSGFGDIDVREMHSLGVEAMIEKPLARMTLLNTLEDSLRNREELWLAPLHGYPQRSLSIDLASPERIGLAEQFQLGRGGCCFPCDQPVARGQTIDLTIQLASGARCLRSQGEVRWYDHESGLAGVAFRYLDPTCRDWVIDWMNTRMPRSFIPYGIAPATLKPGPPAAT